jgi:sugar/nucleoside kinase (ribokinase family)
MRQDALRLPPAAPYDRLIGVGGIGTGIFFALEGDHTLGRNESRPGRLLDVRDYCKLHIIAHYAAVLLGADPSGVPFHVLPIGRVGDDQAGRRLREEMALAGMDTRFVLFDSERPTLLSVCFQYPDGAGGNITPTNGAASALTAEDVACAEGHFAGGRGRAIALAAPEVPLEVRLHLLRMARAYGALCVASLTSAEMQAARDLGLLSLVDVLAMNEDEAGALVGCRFDAGDPEPFLTACARELAALQPAMRIVLSAGREGAYAFAGGTWDHCPAPSVPVASTAGAGDALLAGVIACLAAGLPLISPEPPRVTLGDRPLAAALDLGVLLASYSVTSPHTIHPGANVPALREFARRLGLSFSGPLCAAMGEA